MGIDIGQGATRGPVVAEHWAANVLPKGAVGLAVKVAQRFKGSEAELSGAGTGTRPVGIGDAARKALGSALQEYRTRTQRYRA